MPGLPQNSASVQVTSGQRRPQNQITGARAAGTGVAALGQGIQTLTGNLAAFLRTSDTHASDTLANQLAANRYLAFQKAAMDLKLGTENRSPKEVRAQAASLLQDFIQVSPEEQQQLGPAGMEKLTTLTRGWLPALSNDLAEFTVGYTVKHTVDTATATSDLLVRDIVADTKNRAQRVQQLTDYWQGVPEALIPDKQQRLTKALDDAKLGIVFDEARTNPSVAAEKLSQEGGYAVPGIGDGLSKLSPAQREQAWTEVDKATVRMAARQKQQEVQEHALHEEEKRLALNSVLGAMFNGQDWQAQLGMLYAPPGSAMMSPPVIDSSDVERITRFGAWVAEQRAKGGAPDPQAESKMRLAVVNGEVTSPDMIWADTTMNAEQKNNLSKELMVLQAKRQEQGRAGWEQRVKTGKAYIAAKFGRLPGLLRTVAPKNEDILDDFLLSYDAQMEAQYEKIAADHPGRGADFVQALKTAHPQEEAVKFVREKFNQSGYLDDRLNAETETLMGLMAPYLKKADYEGAIDTDIANGKLQPTDKQILMLALDMAKRQGWTMEELRAGRKGPPVPGQPTTPEKEGNLMKLLRGILEQITGLFGGGTGNP